jgi:hypothetical protein
MHRRELLALASGAVASGLLAPFDRLQTVVAAEPAADAPVTLMRTDGTIARGKITAYDRDKVTMDVIGKALDPAVSTEFKWDEIKHISTGLTREMALQKWKAERLDMLCKTCHGDGKIFCDTCHGIGHDPAASIDCPKCKGAAQLTCTTPRCDHGTIPCTNPKCLKLSDPGWSAVEPNGQRWRKFPVKNGFRRYSDHHLGHVIDKVGDDWVDLGKCPVCGGVQTIGDPVCRSSGDMPCPTCAKKTDTPPCPAKCDAGTVGCPVCKGTGLRA